MKQLVHIIGMNHLHEVEITKSTLQIKLWNTFSQVVAVHEDEQLHCVYFQHIFTKMFSAGNANVVTQA